MSQQKRKRRFWIVPCITICLLIGLAFVFARPAMYQYRLWRARGAILNRAPEQALVWLEAAERSNAEGEVYFLMARSHRHLEAYSETIECLAQAYQRGYPVEALEREKLLALAESAKLAPGDSRLADLLANPGGDAREIFESLVKGYYRLYELGPAMLVLDSWEANYPRDAQPRIYRGLLSEHDEKWAEAETWFRRAMQLAPGRGDIRLHLARVLRKQHRYREAVAFYQSSLQNQATSEAFVGLGKCLRARGKLAAARDAFLQGLEVGPDNYDCLLALGELAVDAGKGNDALPWLEPAAKQKPREYDVRYALAKALLFSGQDDLAKPHFRFAAQARLALSRVKVLREYVVSHPEDVARRYEIGVALLEYGDVPEGLKWLNSVLEYQPDHRDAHKALSDFYSGQGDEQAAARHRAVLVKPSKC